MFLSLFILHFKVLNDCSQSLDETNITQYNRNTQNKWCFLLLASCVSHNDDWHVCSWSHLAPRNPPLRRQQRSWRELTSSMASCPSPTLRPSPKTSVTNSPLGRSGRPAAARPLPVSGSAPIPWRTARLSTWERSCSLRSPLMWWCLVPYWPP